jgi:hypothetical protein
MVSPMNHYIGTYKFDPTFYVIDLIFQLILRHLKDKINGVVLFITNKATKYFIK